MARCCGSMWLSRLASCALLLACVECGFAADIHVAAMAGDLGWVQKLVAKGVHVNSRLGGDLDGRTPLFLAVQYEQYDVAEFLLKHGADANAKNKLLETPLHLASARGDYRTAHLLLTHKANAAARDSGGLTPLHCAVKAKSLDTVQLLVENGAKVGAADSNGWTPLHGAVEGAEGDDCEMIVFLLNKGAPIDAQSEGMTPLAVAAQGGDATAVRCLLERHAQPNIDRGSYLKIADTRPDMTWRRNYSPLHTAIEDGKLQIARLLIKCGADVNKRDWVGVTPLLSAVQGDEDGIEEVRLLLASGANVSLRYIEGYGDPTLDVKGEGYDALDVAVSGGQIEVARLLLDAGADATAALSEAVESGAENHRDMCVLLVERGANVALEDAEGRRPIHCAADRGLVEDIRLLIEHGADVNVKDKEGMTPLHLAAKNGHREAAELLLESRADANASNRKGWTPLDLTDKPDMMDLLRRNGAR